MYAYRYIAVCHPMQASTYCTKQNVRRGIMAILLFAVLFSIPQVLFGFRNHRNHWTIYYDIDYIYFLGFVPLFMYLLPLSILIFVTLRLRSQLKSTSGQILTNQSLSQRRKRDRKITLSLIVIMTVFHNVLDHENIMIVLPECFMNYKSIPGVRLRTL